MAAMAEARRRVRQAVAEGRDPDPTLAQLIGQHQASVAAPSTRPQRAAEEELTPAKANMVRAALEAGMTPVRVAREFGVAEAAVRRLRAGKLRRPRTKTQQP